MQNQQQLNERIPFEFQGTTFYRTRPSQTTTLIVDTEFNRGNVYDSEISEQCIGIIVTMRIRNEKTKEWNELPRNFTITSSHTGYTYIYDFNTERLLHFIYYSQYVYSDVYPFVHIQLNRNITPPYTKLEEFNKHIIRINEENDSQGAFHILDLHEEFPEEQFEPVLK